MSYWIVKKAVMHSYRICTAPQSFFLTLQPFASALAQGPISGAPAPLAGATTHSDSFWQAVLTRVSPTKLMPTPSGHLPMMTLVPLTQEAGTIGGSCSRSRHWPNVTAPPPGDTAHPRASGLLHAPRLTGAALVLDAGTRQDCPARQEIATPEAGGAGGGVGEAPPNVHNGPINPPCDAL